MNKKIYIGIIASFLLVSCNNNQYTSSSFSSEEGKSETVSSSQEEISSSDDYVANTYYFDSTSNEGDGSKLSPFSSLEDFSKLELVSGDKILFKKNSSFEGQLKLENINGSKEHPIIISTYGEGSFPKIDGNNFLGEGILYIKNCSYLTIEGFEIFDSNKEEGDRRGVLIELTSENTEIKTYAGITLNNLYIHDIYGYSDKENTGMSTKSKITGGIHLWSKDGKARSKDLTIKNCKIDNVSNVGVASWYKVNGSKVEKVSPYSDTFQSTAHQNLLIYNNEISNVAKNAIFLRNAYQSYIKNNIVHDSATTCKAGNSIVTSYVDEIIVERNEGYNNVASDQGNGKYQDGAMLDADLQSKKVTFQYNYSHDNSFGLFLNCNSDSSTGKGASDEIILRYNVSINDKGRKGIIYVNYYVGAIECYNNTIIACSSDSPILLQANDNRSMHCYNNIFYAKSNNPSISLGNMKNLSFENNLFYSTSLIENIDDLGDYYSFDPLPKNEFKDDVSSRLGLDRAMELANMEEEKVFDSEYSTYLEEEPLDFASNPYRQSLGAINRKAD